MKQGKDFDVDIQACSAMDCTGLIPALPQDDAELESYQQLFPFQAKAGTESDKNKPTKGGQHSLHRK